MNERGFATIQYVAVAALSMFLFAALANLIVMQYASGVVRAAVDEGARRGAVAGEGVEGCLAQAAEVMDGLLGGPYGETVAVSCTSDGITMTAVASGSLAGFVPIVPDIGVSVQASAPLED